MVDSLRKVDFSHILAILHGKMLRPPPLEKILGAPLPELQGYRSLTPSGLRRVPLGFLWQRINSRQKSFQD